MLFITFILSNFFSAEPTKLYFPWKHKKNQLPKVGNNSQLFASLLPWAAQMARNWKSMSEIGLRHPLLYLLCDGVVPSNKQKKGKKKIYVCASKKGLI